MCTMMCKSDWGWVSWCKHGKWVGPLQHWEEGSSCVWEHQGKLCHIAALTVPTAGLGWLYGYRTWENTEDWLPDHDCELMHPRLSAPARQKDPEPVPTHQGVTVPLVQYPPPPAFQKIMHDYFYKYAGVSCGNHNQEFIFQERYTDWKVLLCQENKICVLRIFICFISVTIWYKVLFTNPVIYEKNQFILWYQLNAAFTAHWRTKQPFKIWSWVETDKRQFKIKYSLDSKAFLQS